MCKQWQLFLNQKYDYNSSFFNLLSIMVVSPISTLTFLHQKQSLLVDPPALWQTQEHLHLHVSLPFH